MSNNTDFTMPVDGYLTFDALSLKQFVKDRLNETGVFTDQNFEGSYISTVVEIIAIVFNQLLYYLNRTSNESLFSEAQLYENMNRIVKILNYSPIGKQTPLLNFKMTASSSLTPQIYTIPRYSYIENGEKSYSINEDLIFAKTSSGSQTFDDLTAQKMLYQGKYVEHTIYTSIGNENELIYLAPGENIIVDHFNIDIYVEKDGLWSKWNKTPSLYLENAFSKTYEIRLNENKQYEIKFGNNINGLKLNYGDRVQIYYLQSNGSAGEAGIGEIDGKPLNLFYGKMFNTILSNINNQNINSYTYITSTEKNYLSFTNDVMSTEFQDIENVDSIKQNAPGVFRSQYRLVTENDYANYIKTNFANLIHDVKVCSNWDYMTQLMKYYYDIGITNPNNITNIMYNQIIFANTCNFNNVYIIAVPRTITNTKNPTSVLTPAQSELIISSLKDTKILTSETVIIDPVYIAAAICGYNTGDTLSKDNIDNSKIEIKKIANSRRSDESIIQDVAEIFTNYFNRNNMGLGFPLSISDLTNQILAVEGVETFYTIRTDILTKYKGLSMLIWNNTYQSDMSMAYKDTDMQFFKFLYLYDSDNISDMIQISTDITIYETVEY